MGIKIIKKFITTKYIPTPTALFRCATQSEAVGAGDFQCCLQNMPNITTQKEYQKLAKPNFCYFCGKPLNNEEQINSDHCPPEKIFHVSDRINYPVKLNVHKKCNHNWHIGDEKFSIFFDVLHGSQKVNNPQLRNKLSFVNIENEQGVYQGLTNFPFKALSRRIIRCMHALLYGKYLPEETLKYIHYPIPEVDPSEGNKPLPHLMQTYAFANELCTAQKAKTYDSLIAYNSKFKYINTWSQLDNGKSICIFTYDIYKLSNFAVKIKNFPLAVIGFYSCPRPKNATKCTDIKAENLDSEILYPILQS